ncbi:MAG: alpha/beta hydrolase [Rhodocyclaceae bacterium]|jgi:pimeloyl-ACP methyl ester carboxylesterase|nr:alpha/beta hydrolase [Rhodocyclaceae bacterium]
MDSSIGRSSISHFPVLRGRRHHVRAWATSADAGAPLLFLLHGWGDVSASFQFVVDALQRSWRVIAPDWRGFGLSWDVDASGAAEQAYWFPDYLADLEAVLMHYQPHGQVTLVGHSMGGNVACLYAGVRPERVRAVVALDAFGLPARPADEAPGRLAQWLDQLAAPQGFRRYADRQAFVARLMRDNPRLRADRAAFLAEHMLLAATDGGWRVAIDPAHRHVNPVPYRRAEALACWRRVQARVLWVEQADPAWRRRLGLDDASHAEGAACFARLERAWLAGTGHNMHHDQPERLAQLIEQFVTGDTDERAAG